MTLASDTVRARADYLKRNKSLVIDGDVHLSSLDNLPPHMADRMARDPNYFHGRPISAEDAIREMSLAKINMALVWQNPSTIVYGDNQTANYKALLDANLYILDAALRHPTHFIPAGWTDPKALGVEAAGRLAQVLIEDHGCVIVKMNPAQNAFPMDGREVIATLEAIIGSGAIPAFHFGADTPHTPPESLEILARRFPETPIIAVHMGGGGAGYVDAEEHYQKVRRLGLNHPNLFFILSAKRDTHIESDLIVYQQAGSPFCHNIACASDAPYGRMAWNFGGYRLMFNSLLNGESHTDQRLREHPDLFSARDVDAYMGGNISNLIIRASERWLQCNSED